MAEMDDFISDAPDCLYGCCPHCIDHEPGMAHDEPCENDICPGSVPLPD